jgi:hypothetical protein
LIINDLSFKMEKLQHPVKTNSNSSRLFTSVQSVKKMFFFFESNFS